MLILICVGVNETAQGKGNEENQFDVMRKMAWRDEAIDTVKRSRTPTDAQLLSTNTHVHT